MSLRVAILAPAGTYTHQAAHNLFEESAEYIPQPSISDCFRAVPDVDYAVVPQENSTFGSVMETYEALRNSDGCFVVGETVLDILHCLVVRKGTKHDDIQAVMSHEQALGQCRAFLSQKFPANIPREKASSTAAAAKALSSGTIPSSTAVICSALCTTLFPGLEVLYSGIQDEAVNQTRFFVLSASMDKPPPAAPPPKNTALIRLTPLNLLDHLKLIENAKLSRIDRRPAGGSAQLFQDVYFLEVQGKDVVRGWAVTTVKRMNESGGKATLLGVW